MSTHDTGMKKRDLLHSLLGQITTGEPRDVDRALGVLGPDVPISQAPQHCLRDCLEGDPKKLATHGCAWLRAAKAGTLDPQQATDDACRWGYRCTARTVQLNRSNGFFLAVEKPMSGAGVPTQAPLDGVAAGQAALAQLDAMQGLAQRVDTLLAENSGLAEEVLRSYEQLNLIYEFTQLIARVTDPDEMEQLLMLRLGNLLHAPMVMVVEPGGSHRCFDVAKQVEVRKSEFCGLPALLTGQLAAVRRERKADVVTMSGGSVLLAPLQRLDERIDGVFVVRPEGSVEFTSGDLLMAESVLAFGGQIISNTELHARYRRVSMEATRALVAAIDKKDHYTCGHSERVGLLARLTGEELGMPPHELDVLEMAGLLHDVGKIGIPEDILNKRGRLTDEEFDVIKQHPQMGYEILKPIASFEVVLNGALYHHENWDGTGYPDGLRGDQIPIVARIIHVVDVFDALSSTRSYRKAFSIEKATEIVTTEAGTKFDANVISAFMIALKRFQEEYARQFNESFHSEVDESEGD